MYIKYMHFIVTAKLFTLKTNRRKTHTHTQNIWRETSDPGQPMNFFSLWFVQVSHFILFYFVCLLWHCFGGGGALFFAFQNSMHNRKLCNQMFIFFFLFNWKELSKFTLKLLLNFALGKYKHSTITEKKFGSLLLISCYSFTSSNPNGRKRKQKQCLFGERERETHGTNW